MDELIKALRKCGVECKCYGCPYENKTGMNEKFKCIHMILSDAADAIERLQAENDELRAEKDSAERHEKDFFLKLLFATDEQLAELRDEARRQVRDLIILGEEKPNEKDPDAF